MRHLRCGCLGAVAVGILVGASGIASAADIPLKALPPPVPLFAWTGFYGGANVSYSWGSSVGTTDIDPGTAAAALYSEGIQHHGWEASVEGGYCYQPGRDRDSNFVACLEARYDFPAERSGQTNIPIPPTVTTTTTVTSTTHIDPILLGPHLGFTTNANRTFWYGAGGLALGEVGGNSTGTDATGTSTASPGSKWVAGWFLGAGAEQMLTNNWSVKVEYDYVRLDTGGVTATYAGTNTTLNPVCGGGVGNVAAFACAPAATATVASHPFDNVVTVGINYHFH
jgi:outer membrane immunogenic protein